MKYRLIQGDCLEVLKGIPDGMVDMVFADPPYNLSNDGGTCKGGKWVSVNKGDWDRSRGVMEDHEFNLRWLAECQRVLKPNGTIWVSGTYHVIYSLGFAMQTLGFRTLNDVCWFKRNASPNLSGRYFTASHETLIWAAKNASSRHTFNYDMMRTENGGKQMRTMWEINSTPPREKLLGKHPTQKPLTLLRRIVRSSTNPGGLVLDPFCGSGTTGVAAIGLGREFIGIEVDAGFLELTRKRIENIQPHLDLESASSSD